jgi:NAD(P)-dependent dehydrogenase (short-subunit alcohol dehydrogenase family)
MRIDKRDKMIGALAGAVVGALAVRWLARPKYSFRGKTVVVTGGSRGLGLVLGRALAREGARVVLCARELSTLARACDEIADGGGEVLAIAADVTSAEDVTSLVAAVEDRFGPIDVLVNNAGNIEVGPFDAMTETDFARAMDTHFWGPLRLMRAVLPSMRARGEGRILNVVSIGGLIPMPHLAPYTASKFALGALSEAMRAEVARDGVTVTTVYPGLMRTGSTRHAEFKGRFRAEHAWFTVLDAMPVASMSADRAARRILDACRRGEDHVVLSAPAKIAAFARGVAPGLVGNLMALVNRLLPSPGGDVSRSHKGYESESPVTLSMVTRLDRKAAAANNEVAPLTSARRLR